MLSFRGVSLKKQQTLEAIYNAGNRIPPNVSNDSFLEFVH